MRLDTIQTANHQSFPTRPASSRAAIAMAALCKFIMADCRNEHALLSYGGPMRQISCRMTQSKIVGQRESEKERGREDERLLERIVGELMGCWWAWGPLTI